MPIRPLAETVPPMQYPYVPPSPDVPMHSTHPMHAPGLPPSFGPTYNTHTRAWTPAGKYPVNEDPMIPLTGDTMTIVGNTIIRHAEDGIMTTYGLIDVANATIYPTKNALPTLKFVDDDTMSVVTEKGTVIFKKVK